MFDTFYSKAILNMQKSSIEKQVSTELLNFSPRLRQLSRR